MHATNGEQKPIAFDWESPFYEFNNLCQVPVYRGSVNDLRHRPPIGSLAIEGPKGYGDEDDDDEGGQAFSLTVPLPLESDTWRYPPQIFVDVIKSDTDYYIGFEGVNTHGWVVERKRTGEHGLCSEMVYQAVKQVTDKGCKEGKPVIVNFSPFVATPPLNGCICYIDASRKVYIQLRPRELLSPWMAHFRPICALRFRNSDLTP